VRRGDERQGVRPVPQEEKRKVGAYGSGRVRGRSDLAGDLCGRKSNGRSSQEDGMCSTDSELGE